MKQLIKSTAGAKIALAFALVLALMVFYVPSVAVANEGAEESTEEVSTVEEQEDATTPALEEASEEESMEEIPDASEEESTLAEAPTEDTPVGTLNATNSTLMGSAPQFTPAAAVTPDIHSVRYSTINSSYSGIVVDSYFRNFDDATGLRVIIHRADGSDAVREGGPDTIAHINSGGNKALTIPFNFAGSSAGGWFGAQSSIWLPSQKPVGVTLEVMTTSHGLISFSTPISQQLVQKNGIYESIIPTYLPETTLVVEGAEDGLVGATFTISGDAYSAHGLNRVYVQLVNRATSQRYGGTTINLLSEGTNAHWTVTYTPASGLPEGIYAAHVQVVDRSGQRADVGWSDNFELDKTMPVFEIMSPVNGSLVRGDQRVTVKITDANDIAKVLVNVGDGHGSYVWEDGKGNVTRDGDLFHLDIDTTQLTDGVNHVVIRATDGAGNTRYFNNNANTRTHSYSVDNTKPTAEIVALDAVEGDTEIRGVASDNFEIRSHWFEVKAPGGEHFYKYFPTTSHEVSFYLSELAPVVEGDYVVRYVVTDKAGNRNDDPGYANSETKMITVTFSVVVTDPPATSKAPASTGKTSTTGTTIPSSVALILTEAEAEAEDTEVTEEGESPAATSGQEKPAVTVNSSGDDQEEVAAATDSGYSTPAGDMMWLWFVCALMLALTILLIILKGRQKRTM